MADDPAQQTLEGTLERLTYHNDENGYTVAKLVPRGKSYEVTITGALAGVSVGEYLRLQGIWTTHPRYGRQFEVHRYAIKLPATVEGIRKYLGSGLVKGVGPVTAGRIVDYFGLQTLEVIEDVSALYRERLQYEERGSVGGRMYASYLRTGDHVLLFYALGDEDAPPEPRAPISAIAARAYGGAIERPAC